MCALDGGTHQRSAGVITTFCLKWGGGGGEGGVDWRTGGEMLFTIDEFFSSVS